MMDHKSNTNQKQIKIKQKTSRKMQMSVGNHVMHGCSRTTIDLRAPTGEVINRSISDITVKSTWYTRTVVQEHRSTAAAFSININQYLLVQYAFA